eukprot:EG_transcript_4427
MLAMRHSVALATVGRWSPLSCRWLWAAFSRQRAIGSCRCFRTTITASAPELSLEESIALIKKGDPNAVIKIADKLKQSPTLPSVEDLAVVVAVLLREWKLRAAEEVLNLARDRGHVLAESWRSLLNAVIAFNNADHMARLIPAMLEMGVVPAPAQLFRAVAILARKPETFPRALDLIQRLTVDGLVDARTEHVLRLNAHSHGGEVDAVEALLARPAAPLRDCLGTAFYGYLHATQYDRAREMLARLTRAGLQPGYVVYDAVISFHSTAASYEVQESVKKFMTSLGMSLAVHDLKLSLDGLSRQMAQEHFKQALGSMQQDHQKLMRIVGSFMEFYADTDDLPHAALVEDLFALVPKGRAPPPSEARDALVCAYCRAGDVAKAQRTLQTMQEAQQTPAPETLEAIAELLFRCGQTDAALAMQSHIKVDLPTLQRYLRDPARRSTIREVVAPSATALLRECAAAQAFATAVDLLTLLDTAPEARVEAAGYHAVVRAMLASEQLGHLEPVLQHMRRGGVGLPPAVCAAWAKAKLGKGEVQPVEQLQTLLRQNGMEDPAILEALVTHHIASGNVNGALETTQRLREAGEQISVGAVDALAEGSLLAGKPDTLFAVVDRLGLPSLHTCRWLVGHLVSHNDVARATELVRRLRPLGLPPDSIIARVLYDAYRRGRDFNGARQVLADLRAGR